MTIQCPRCPTQIQDKLELYTHLKSIHKLSDAEAQKLAKASGWYEQKTQTTGGTPVALEHQTAALRSQIQHSKSFDVPMIATSIKEDFKLPDGWTEGVDNEFLYEQEIIELNSYNSSTGILIRAKVTQANGHAELVKSFRDLTKLKQMQEKEIVLKSRLSSRTVTDPDFHVIAKEILEVTNQIAQEKEDIEPEKEIELLLEDNWGRDLEEADMQKAQLEFMGKVNTEYSRQKEKCQSPRPETARHVP